MNLPAFLLAKILGTNQVPPSRRPLPIFGVASWTCLALGMLGYELILLWDSYESLELAGGVYMMPFVVGGLYGAVAAGLRSLRRRERLPGIAWASLGLVILLVVAFIVLMLIGLVQDILSVWHS